MLSTKEAARLLGISKRAVQKAIERETLKAQKIGRDWFIEQSAVDEYREKYLRKPGRK